MGVMVLIEKMLLSRVKELGRFDQGRVESSDNVNFNHYFSYFTLTKSTLL